MQTKELSVFFPLVNEEENVLETVKQAKQVLEKLKVKYEILLINDGSSDNTASIIDNLARTDPTIRAIHHEKNLGYGEALKSGFYNAKYKLIVYTDGDRQFDFTEVSKFLDKIDDYDVLIGYRIKRQDPFFRILFKEGWRLALFTFFRLTTKDVDCGFKMVRREVIEKIAHLESTRGGMINAELAIKSKKAGFRIGQIGVNHYPRVAGKPTGANVRVIVKSFLDLFKLWWNLKEQKLIFLLIIATLILALVVRLWQIDGYMTFLGDEGRDALIIKKMLAGDIPFIGPPTSIGNIYLGPLYYYMMFVPMALTDLNPISAAVMNALIGTVTVAFIYYLGKQWFGRSAALIASFLYAISPVNIIYSRSSWNPNPTPFFALIVMYSLFRLNKSGNFYWLIPTCISLAAALNMHYMALILIPIATLLCIYEVWYRINKKKKINHLLVGLLLGKISFILIMMPLILFDLKHNFMNFRAITELFTRSDSLSLNPLLSILHVPDILLNNLIGQYMSGGSLYLALIIAFIGIFAMIYYWNIHLQKKREMWPNVTITVWIVLGLIGASFLNNAVFAHYLGFMNPAFYLLFGAGVVLLWERADLKILVRGFLMILIVVLIGVNLQQSPLLSPPNHQLRRTQDVAKFILNQAGGIPFNFALLAERNYDAAYQFYLEQYGSTPRMLPNDKTDQLFVVCEDQVCQPEYSAKYELAAFGWRKIDKMWDYQGVKVYKIISNPDQFKEF